MDIVIAVGEPIIAKIVKEEQSFYCFIYTL